MKNGDFQKMQLLEENFDVIVLRCLAVFYLTTNLIQIYTFVYCSFSLLLGYFPNTFVLGCGAASYLLEVYVSNLLIKHNFDVDEVIEKRRKEQDQYNDEDLS